MSQAKNVLFIIIDQLRADCLSGALADYVDLPNLRAFMQEAVTFTRHYSVTNPCGPSRASLLTGQYAMNHRSVRNGTPLRHDTPNIATEMRKAGYMPLLFGYTDTSADPRVHDANDPVLKSYEQSMTGFLEVVEMRLEESYPWQAHLMKKGYEFDQYWDVYKPTSKDGQTPKLNDPALYRAEDSDTAFLTDAFLEGIAPHCGEGWFAHLTYIRPHPPLVAPAPYNDMYNPAEIPLPQRLHSTEAEKDLHPFFGPTQNSYTAKDFVHGFDEVEPTDENIRTLRAVYLGLATEVDHHIGRVVKHLKDSGQYDDTMLVITADHGEMLGDRHSWGKMTVYDAAYHTPLMIRLPGNNDQAGARVSVPTESVDVAPTILRWIGQPAPNAMDGRSLMPLLRDEVPEDWRSYSFSELDFSEPENPTLWQQQLETGNSDSCLGILRDERFTLIEFAADLPPILFDHQSKGEFENVAHKPELAPDLARLSRQMLRHRMKNMDHTLSLHSITSEGAKSRSRY
ncbi:MULTISPECIES: alkaline phosphatase family protein [unclassified Ruegeria]|uniref:alkaline phosphatase family protein n=1 Tax=unclassified Ruegeria TaxID=2625375 RepID=UPI0014910E6B|nr:MULTISPECIES: alkaline phosphatase family protein [unclassified Ruegeria]NOD47560.1 sulfatase-like hydrolase/transferase [Ruegeria sp. HKCCD5849]NOD52777.1 sulfatase-like hydrolase/transferase [Ruegeria sp. HKCCD5851]NOD66196.1 sulfatase-like hydrolase/transferase [Ruegeria sp. HKCCD7303]